MIKTENGRCVIKPASGHASDEEYSLSGERFYDFESPWPLFRGTPRLRLSRAEQPARTVPPIETSWRQRGGDWKSYPTGLGLWEVRHVRAGELRYFSRIGILPEQFSLSIEPGSDMSHGYFRLHNSDAIRVVGQGSEADITTTDSVADIVRVQVKARDATNPPAHVRLRLHWASAKELTVQAPFPGQGGRILHDGRASDGNLAVDDLYGVRAIALSSDRTQKFWIEGELKAPDAGELLRVAHFRQPLRKYGVMYELPLIDLRHMIELLLSASPSSDSHVALHIVDRFQNIQGKARVSRFSAILECNLDMALISVSPKLDSDTAPTLEAFPLTRPGDNPIAIKTPDVDDFAHCSMLLDNIDLSEPWLLVMRHDDKIRARPVRVSGPLYLAGDTNSDQAWIPSLTDALTIEDSDLRIESLGRAMDTILAKETSDQNERDWLFLTNSLLQAQSLPVNALDLFKVLVTRPRLVVRCLFGLESAPRQILWHLGDELPFSWLLIQRDIWWTEADRAVVQLREQLAGIMDEHDRIARKHVLSILSEGEERYPALKTIFTDCKLRMEGNRLSGEFVKTILQERDDKTPEQIRMRANLDDWPNGYGRKEWASELGEIPPILWQSKDEHRVRQPAFDTPVAAAWCCCFLRQPTARTTFLVKRIRAHDPDWFDLAYRASWFSIARMQDNARR